MNIAGASRIGFQRVSLLGENGQKAKFYALDSEGKSIKAVVKENKPDNKTSTFNVYIPGIEPINGLVKDNEVNSEQFIKSIDQNLNPADYR